MPNNLVRFIHPNRYRAAFLMEWGLFILLQIAIGKVTSFQRLGMLLYPLFLFYLAGCWFANLQVGRIQQFRLSSLIKLAIGLAGIDQVVIQLMAWTTPENWIVSLPPGWLELKHLPG